MSSEVPKQQELWLIDFNRKKICSSGPLTSEKEKLKNVESFEVLIEIIPENGLDKKSKILLHRLLAIDKEERLITKLGTVDTSKAKEGENSLRKKNRKLLAENQKLRKETCQKCKKVYLYMAAEEFSFDENLKKYSLPHESSDERKIVYYLDEYLFISFYPENDDGEFSEVRLFKEMGKFGENSSDNLIICGDSLNALTSLTKIPEYQKKY
ncbi:18812_t:CDS:2, partial [Funneliformis geosporum]